MDNNVIVNVLRHPTEDDWIEVKRRCLVTIGKSTVINPPSEEWKKKILAARHSPIRYLMFSFYIQNIPSWVSVHFVRHVHAQPYVKSQRNDRQSDYDRNTAPQGAPVDMIWDINAEELMTIANKRLCAQASKETRDVVKEICRKVIETNPEFEEFLVPQCEYRGGICTEFYSCGRFNNTNK